MTDDADKPDKPLDENETLVRALESIKGLLATSESKLSQARESISLASAHSLKMTREVPVLDDVVVPGKTLKPAEPETSDSAQSEPETANPDELNSFIAELEKDLHLKLMDYAQQLELEIKQKIMDYLKQQLKPGSDA